MQQPQVPLQRLLPHGSTWMDVRAAPCPAHSRPPCPCRRLGTRLPPQTRPVSSGRPRLASSRSPVPQCPRTGRDPCRFQHPRTVTKALPLACWSCCPISPHRDHRCRAGLLPSSGPHLPSHQPSCPHMRLDSQEEAPSVAPLPGPLFSPEKAVREPRLKPSQHHGQRHGSGAPPATPASSAQGGASTLARHWPGFDPCGARNVSDLREHLARSELSGTQ